MSTTLLFLGAVAVIAANQAVLRVATLRSNPYVFWSLQAVNLVVACYVFLFGLPGFEVGYTRWFGYVIGLLLVFRIVQNNMLRQRYLRHEVEQQREEERRERSKELALRIAQEASESPAPAASAADEARPPGEPESLG